MHIKNTTTIAPLKGSVKRINKIIWGEWNNFVVRVVIYNKVDVEEQRLSKGASMSNDQFQKLMNQMSSMEERIYTNIGNKISSMEKRINTTIDAKLAPIREDINSINIKLDNLTEIVKKNHPADFE